MTDEKKEQPVFEDPSNDKAYLAPPPLPPLNPVAMRTVMMHEEGNELKGEKPSAGYILFGALMILWCLPIGLVGFILSLTARGSFNGGSRKSAKRQAKWSFGFSVAALTIGTVWWTLFIGVVCYGSIFSYDPIFYPEFYSDRFDWNVWTPTTPSFYARPYWDEWEPTTPSSDWWEDEESYDCWKWGDISCEGCWELRGSFYEECDLCCVYDTPSTEAPSTESTTPWWEEEEAVTGGYDDCDWYWDMPCEYCDYYVYYVGDEEECKRCCNSEFPYSYLFK